MAMCLGPDQLVVPATKPGEKLQQKRFRESEFLLTDSQSMIVGGFFSEEPHVPSETQQWLGALLACIQSNQDLYPREDPPNPICIQDIS